MVDVSDSVNDIWWRLNFLSLEDLDATDTYVTSDELYGFADEAAQLLAYRTGTFITVETIAVTAGIARYVLPAANVFTLGAWLGSQNLRISPVRELAALDATWPTTSGPPTRASFDADVPGVITLYPRPTAGGTLKLIAAEAPASIAAGSSTVQVPQVFQDLFSYSALNGARIKESEGRQQEMGEHYGARADLYLDVAAFLYGGGA